jgi:L-arabinose transport system permease protein
MSNSITPSTTVLAPVPAPLNRRKWLIEHSMPIAYAALFSVLAVTVENFFSVPNVIGLMLSVAQIGMVACTMMLCLASRDFDLSVGSTIAF